MSYNNKTKMYEGYIYIATNKQNGMKYIGQTTTTINSRWSAHKCASKSSNLYFHNAIKYYGENNFNIEELLNTSSTTKPELVEKLNVLEIDFISKFNTTYPLGYNLTIGGNNSINNSRSVCQYSKSGVLINTFTSIENAASILCIGSSGVIGVCSGKKMTCHGWVFRYCEDNFDKYQIIEKHKKSVKRYSVDGVFIKQYESLTEAAKDIGMSIKLKGSISDVCEGKTCTCYGYVFRYTNDDFSKYEVTNGTKKVKQYDLLGNHITTFNSFKSASESTGIKSSSISGVCAGVVKSVRGYVFRYVNDDFDKYIKTDPKKAVTQYDLSGNFISRYNSVKEAGISNNLCSSAITKCCKGKVKSVGGFRFTYANKILSENYKNNQLKPVMQYSKDGVFLAKYSSITEAGKSTNINIANLQKVCANKVKSAGGYIWRYDIEEGENN